MEVMKNKVKIALKWFLFIVLVVFLAFLGNSNDPTLTGLFKGVGFFALVYFFYKVFFEKQG